MKAALPILILSLPSFFWTRIAGADNNCNVTLNDVDADRIWVVVSHSSSPSTPTDSGVSSSNTWVQAVSSTNAVGVEIWYTSNFPANTGSSHGIGSGAAFCSIYVEAWSGAVTGTPDQTASG
jgi:hypothetical protein